MQLPGLAILLSASILTGCGLLHTVPERTKLPRPPSHSQAVVVLVGGNSECSRHRGVEKGIWKLYGGAQQAAQRPILRDIAAAARLKPDQISAYYFSWTGDGESHSGCLPGRHDYVENGSGRIVEAMRWIAERDASLPLVIVGWSNGGATAYELACRLTREHKRQPVALITLDPAAHSTTPCAFDPEDAEKVAARWLHVYTASGRWNRFRTTNIIALFGNAWNAVAPPRNTDPASGPGLTVYMTPLDHSDTECMWSAAVAPRLAAMLPVLGNERIASIEPVYDQCAARSGTTVRVTRN